MSAYRTLRLLRILLWGAFIISLAGATAWKGDVTAIGTVARYLPPAFLVLALVMGLFERLYRTRHGLAPLRFGRG